MRKLLLIVLSLWLGGLISITRADSFTLNDGSIVSGDIIKFDDNSVMLRAPGDVYTNLQWTMFSQDSLKQLAQNPKIGLLVQPFIEQVAAARPPKPALDLQAVPRLEMPPKTSVIGGLFASSVGMVILLVIYLANLYAAYEIALCRSRPIPAAVGASAVLPIIGPVIFLLLPGAPPASAPVEPGAGAEEPVAAAPSAPTAPSSTIPFTPPPSAAAPGPAPLAEADKPKSGSHGATTSWMPSVEPIAQVKPSSTSVKPQAVSFQRGKFTFNKRFIETKFAAFIKGTASEVLVVATAKDRFTAQRIGQLGQNDMQLICDGAEVVVTYGEIQEIQIKPLNA